MTSVKPRGRSFELFLRAAEARAAEAVEQSRQLCAATRQLIEQTRGEIATVQIKDRQLEAALHEKQRVTARVRSTLRVRQKSSLDPLVMRK